MADVSNSFNKQEWLKYFGQKYANKETVSAGEILEERSMLVKQCGEKIIIEKLEDLASDEEKTAKSLYDFLTKELY